MWRIRAMLWVAAGLGCGYLIMGLPLEEDDCKVAHP